MEGGLYNTSRAHLDDSLFETIGWLKVKDRVSQIELCMVHRIEYGTVPRYLRNYLSRVGEVHDYETRGSSTDFVPPNTNINIGQETFLWSATSRWNSLPGKLKKNRSLRVLKKELKEWLRGQE